MNNKANNLIFNLFEDVKRFQNNIDESLAITLGLIYLIYTDKESFITTSGMYDKDNTYPYIDVLDFYFDNLRNRMELQFVNEQLEEYLVYNIKSYNEFATFSKVDIKNAIENLLHDKCPMLQASSRQTDSFTQKIITKIAKLLNSKGPYIDLAIGTGSLLKDFYGEVWGDDINPKMVIIARCYLYFHLENVTYEDLKNDIRLQDSIETFDYSEYKNAVILFDPPMGDFRLYPKDEKWQNTEIIHYNKPVKLQSEILFLMSFLINANSNDYFIGLFPENILNKNNKDYNSVRKYLIENSLIAVIKVLTGHILLIGKKKLDVKKYPEIPVIWMQTDFKEKQLDSILAEIIKGKNFNFEKHLEIGVDKDFRSITRVVYNRKDFENNYIINLPSKITSEDSGNIKIKSPKELLSSLQEKEDKIKFLIQNLSEKIANIEFDSDKTEDGESRPLWFEEYNEKNDPELINALKYFKMDYRLTPNNINNYQDLQIRKGISADSYYNLKILYKNNRVKLFKNKAKIYFGENKENLQKDINLQEFYNLFNPLKDKELKSIFELINNDENIKLIFEDLCQYWMLNKDEEKTYLKQNKYPLKEFTRCLKVLETLGLVVQVYVSDTGSSVVDLYERYMPNIKYLKSRKFKEDQDV